MHWLWFYAKWDQRPSAHRLHLWGDLRAQVPMVMWWKASASVLAWSSRGRGTLVVVGRWHFQELTGFWQDVIPTVVFSHHYSDFSALLLLASLVGELCQDVLSCSNSWTPKESARFLLSFKPLRNALWPVTGQIDMLSLYFFFFFVVVGFFVCLFVAVLFLSPKLWSFSDLLWESGGTICFPQEKKVFVPKGEMPARPKQLISMTMRPPIFSLLTNAGTLPKLTQQKLKQMHNEARFSPSKT